MIDPPTGDRRHADDRLGALGHGRDAGKQDLPKRRWQRPRGTVVAGHEQLLDEEGVAIRSSMDPIGQVARGRRTQDRLEHLAGVSRIEPLQVHPFDPAAAVELGEPREERVPPVQLVRAEGHDQNDPIRSDVADEERDGLPGRHIGPMQVLDDEDDRGDLGQAMEQAQDGIQQTGLERFALGGAINGDARSERRDEVGEIGPRRADHGLQLGRIQLLSQIAQGLDERRVRHAAVADVGTAAHEDAHPACRRHRRDLGDEPRLADARLAGDELVDR